MMRGLRSFGWTSMSVRAMFRSPQITTATRSFLQRARELLERAEEAHLRVESPAAVRHVDRRDRDRRQIDRDDPVLVVERRMGKRRRLRGDRLLTCRATPE